MNAQEFAKLLDEIDTKVARLRALYENYFQGVERLEPTIARRDVERNIDTVKRGCPNNTGARFRLNTFLARYATYSAYWQRTCRKIEDGTYHKQHERMGRRKRVHAERIEPKEVRFDEQELSEFLNGMDATQRAEREDDDADTLPPAKKDSLPAKVGMPAELANILRAPPPKPNTAKPTSPALLGAVSSFAPPKVIVQKDVAAKISVPPPRGIPRPRTASTAKLSAVGAKIPPPPPPPTTAPKPEPPRSEQNMHQLFERYVEARKQNNESVDRVRYETIAQSVEKMMPKLREKHGSDKTFDFDVILVDGKVGIKPKVRG